MTEPKGDRGLAGPRPARHVVAARRVATAAFAGQGTAIAAVFTTIPVVKQHLGIGESLVTVMIVAVALMAGAGSFVGQAAVRALGPVVAMRFSLLLSAAALVLLGRAPGTAVAIVAYLLFGLTVGSMDVCVNTRGASVERAYGRSVFASFYAAWSAGGIVAALVTAGTNRLGWSAGSVLTAQAVVVAAFAPALRAHRLPDAAGRGAGGPDRLRAGVWARLVRLGMVLMAVYVVDSTISSWCTVYLRQSLGASLSAAPLAYATYQAGTVAGRTLADRLVRRAGPAAVVRGAAPLTAAAVALLAGAPSWPYAVPAAGVAGLGLSVLIPLCLAAGGRLQPGATEAVLARLNVFNYVGLIVGSAASGALGSGDRFRLAYAIAAALALALVASAPVFTARRGAALSPCSPPG
ncbi:MFS transporter [Streptomyces sp. NPDC050560]|uniref:MFS transporter n=1 Tax=Streptomyces sp. NPDC050560 TaxID=3365630 RepID=UPI0037BB7CA1